MVELSTEGGGRTPAKLHMNLSLPFPLLAFGLYDARTVTNYLTKSSISKLT
jgi:hypothetical protein